MLLCNMGRDNFSWYVCTNTRGVQHPRTSADISGKSWLDHVNTMATTLWINPQWIITTLLMQIINLLFMVRRYRGNTCTHVAYYYHTTVQQVVSVRYKFLQNLQIECWFTNIFAVGSDSYDFIHQANRICYMQIRCESLCVMRLIEVWSEHLNVNTYEKCEVISM